LPKHYTADTQKENAPVVHCMWLVLIALAAEREEHSLQMTTG